MKIESRNEGRGILIHRQILSVDETGSYPAYLREKKAHFLL